MSTFSPNKNLELPAHNADIDTWDVPVNADWAAIDASFGNVTALNATSASGNVTLSATQYRPPMLNITGTLTADVSYQVPSGVGGFWLAKNGTTGAHVVSVSSAGGGTSVAIAQGARTLVTSDGTNIALGITSAAGSSTQVQYNASGLLAGSSSFVFDGTNVGIGTSSPGSTLDVKGTLRLSGASSGWVGLTPASAAGNTTYTLPSADGTPGQFLTTNGSAVLSWSGVTTGVVSFSAGTTGFTPATATSGVITLAGTLATTNGGTGLTSFTSGGAVYATSTSALTTGTLPVASGGTGGTTSTGSGAVVLATGPTISSPTLVTPALGTPASGNLANCTGYPVGNVTGFGTGIATFLATPTSANLAAAVTDETGSGALVFGTSPTIASASLSSPIMTTPILGVASATSINKLTITAPASGSTLTIVDSKTLTISKTIQLTAADDTGVYTFPTGTKTLVATDVATLSSLTSAASLATVGTITSGIWNAGAVTSSSTVTATTTVSDNLGNVRTIVQNPQSTNYTLLATDAGKHISISSGNVTVPSAVFTAGQAISGFNNSSGNELVVQGAGVTMYLAGTALTGNRTVSQRGLWTVLCVASNTFAISGAGLS